MKPFKKFLFPLTILALSAGTVLAQHGGPRGGAWGGGGPRGGGGAGGERQRPTREQRQERADKFAEKVGLSDAQKTQIAGLRKQEGEALRALRKDTTLTREQKLAKAKEIREGFLTQSKQLLTPEQQAKAEELRRQAQEKRGDKQPAPPTGG
ncbi:MAG: hypothetical protein HY302_07365 [Opitutae bacterium]|nr:hypothetical protein [Opitutae bacterium]